MKTIIAASLVLLATSAATMAHAELFVTVFNDPADKGIYVVASDGTSEKILSVPQPREISWHATRNELFFGESSGYQLWRISPAGDNLTSVHNYSTAPMAVSIDQVSGQVYVGGLVQATGVGLSRINPDGSGSVLLKNINITHLANYVESERLYYTASLGKVFYYDTLFGGTHEIYDSPSDAGIYGIAVDANNSKVYWSERSQGVPTHSIVRSDLDGGT